MSGQRICLLVWGERQGGGARNAPPCWMWEVRSRSYHEGSLRILRLSYRRLGTLSIQLCREMAQSWAVGPRRWSVR